ncbi:MAG: tripartite tricarboxylate transporter TctB family protein [Burkholderiales bacterium]
MQAEEDRSAAKRGTLEWITAVVLFLLGVLVMTDSVRVGIRWVEDGPQAGYFPFYVGLILCLSSIWNFAKIFLDRATAQKSFVGRNALRLILSMLAPTVVYVVLIGWLGFYVSSIVFIAFFMIWLGKYTWTRSAAVSGAVMICTFLMFEIWFRVPLPKGPLENLLGLA